MIIKVILLYEVGDTWWHFLIGSLLKAVPLLQLLLQGDEMTMMRMPVIFVQTWGCWYFAWLVVTVHCKAACHTDPEYRVCYNILITGK